MATAGAEAMHLVSRIRPPLPVGPDDPLFTRLADDRQEIDEEVVLHDQARIARDVLDSLDERQREVLKLRWDLQLSGPETQAALGLSPRQYQRLAEEGAAAVAERVEELDSGAWSRRQRSLLTACLVEVTRGGDRRVGIATKRQRREAQRLVESDPHVAALYREISGALRRATALLPLPVFVADVDTSPLARLAELASHARNQASNLLETGKQQATSLYIRAADPTLLSSPRPGTAIAAIAGSLALGGGAYGAYEAVSTPTSAARPTTTAPITQIPRPTTHRPASTTPPKPKAKPKATPTSNPPKDPPPMTQPTNPAPTSQPAPPPPPPEPTEFGFEG
jgi:hypothetical protein